MKNHTQNCFSQYFQKTFNIWLEIHDVQPQDNYSSYSISGVVILSCNVW